VYWPLYTEKHKVSYMFLKLKDRCLLPDLATELSNRSVNSVAYLPIDRKSKEVKFFVSTNNEQQTKIIRDVLPKYIEDSHPNKIVYMDFDETDKFWRWEKYRKYLKLDYVKLFNPKTCTWKFDLKKYLKDVDKLADQVQQSS